MNLFSCCCLLCLKMLYICDAYHIRGSSKPASISVAGIFLSAAVADIRFRTPVGSINVPPASLRWHATGKAEPSFFPPSLQISKVMSTVDLTPEKNNGPQRLTKSQRRLERLLKMAGKHALTSKKNYSHYKNVLDFIQDDAGMMETLFRTLECSWTDWRKFKGLVIIISFMAGAARRRKNGLAGLSENGR